MIDMGDECMYASPEVGAMLGVATTLHGSDPESDGDRRVRELRESIDGVAPAPQTKQIGFVWAK